MHLHFPWYFTALFWSFIGSFLTYQFLKVPECLPEDEDEEESEDEDRSEKHIRRVVKNLEDKIPPKPGIPITPTQWEEMKRQHPEWERLEKS